MAKQNINLAQLKRTRGVISGTAGAFLTTSTSYVAVTGLNVLTVNMPFSSGVFNVSGTMFFGTQGTAINDMYFRIIMDGTTISTYPTAGEYRMTQTTIYNANTVSGSFQFTGVSAGNHTFTVQVYTKQGIEIAVFPVNTFFEVVAYAN
jgi:hypothetical protein